MNTDEPLLAHCLVCGASNSTSQVACGICSASERSADYIDRDVVSCSQCDGHVPSADYCADCGAILDKTLPTAAVPVIPPEPTGRARGIGAELTASMGTLRVILPDGRELEPRALSLVGTVVVGRGEVQLSFDDRYMSPRHFEFEGLGSGIRISDLGSLNGTYLRCTAPMVVPPGGRIFVGRQMLSVAYRDPAAHYVDREETIYLGSDARTQPWALERLSSSTLVRDIYTVEPQGLTLGRHRGDIVLPDDTFLSGEHVRFDPADDGVLVTDLQSSNGTWVETFQATELGTGDTVLAGMTRLTIFLPEPT